MKGKLKGIRLNVGEAGGALDGDGEHGIAEIAADDAGTSGMEGLGDVAGSAADIESLDAGRYGGELEHAALPIAVEAKALEIIDEVVTARDTVEQ